MKKYYSRLSLLFMTAFMVSVFTGCTNPPDVDENDFTVTSFDFGASTLGITTKISQQTFPLTVLYADEDLADNNMFTGSFGHTLYDINNNQVLNNMDVITYGTATSYTEVLNLNIPTAHQNVRSRLSVCISSTASSSTNCADWWPFACPLGTNYVYTTDAYDVEANSPSCATTCSVADATSPPCNIIQYSTDNFAIRPNNFTFAKTDGGNIHSVTSASNLDLSIDALDFVGSQTNAYSTSDAITLSVSQFFGTSDTIDLTGTMVGTSSMITNPIFTNGASVNTNVAFDNVGKVTLHFQDTNWAAVDIADTPQNCDPDGAYICGDVNATFIPAEFTFDTITVKNANNKTFTYFSNDIDNNMSASMDIVLNARNANGDIVTNFTKGLWEEEMIITIDVSTANIPSLIKTEIDTPLALAFINGSKTIAWDAGDTSEQLKFNFAREVQTPLNPIKIKVGELSLNASASYPTGDVTGTATATNSVTFTYARSHAPRQRFNATSGTDLIYFEVFCNATDTNGVSCDKTLLPNSIASKFTDDPRWFVNSLHTATEGVVGGISQKGTSKTTVSSVSAGTGVTSALINYTGSNYPYKATMQNTASEWLIYDKYSTAAAPTTTNKFEIEFVKAASSWAGAGENSASTASNGATKTNRRTMW